MTETEMIEALIVAMARAERAEAQVSELLLVVAQQHRIIGFARETEDVSVLAVLDAAKQRAGAR